MTKYNWKFVKTGHKGDGVKYMFCNGDELIKEFSVKEIGYDWLPQALDYESRHKITGPRLIDYIQQYNHNQIAIREHKPIKTDITIISLKDWNNLQKQIEEEKN